MRCLLLALAALALPFSAQAQSTKVLDPTTGLPVFSAANPAPVTTTGTVASGATDSGNPVKIGGKYNATPPILTDGQRGDLQIGTRGSVNVTLFAQDSVTTPSISTLTADGVTPGTGLIVHPRNTVFNGSTWDRMPGNTTGIFNIPKPTTSGGLSFIRLIGATNGVIKASAGQLYTCFLMNTNAAVRYLQIYNKATAGTLSTDTPVATAALPTNVQVPVSFLDLGGAFATGISWQETTDDIAIPTTAGSTTDIHGFCTYK